MNLKNKLSKQEEQRQNHGYRERFDGCQVGGGCEGMGEEVRRLRSTNRQLQNNHGDVKYSIGNGAAKELLQRNMNNGGRLPEGGRCWAEGAKGRKIRTTVRA